MREESFCCERQKENESEVEALERIHVSIETHLTSLVRGLPHTGPALGCLDLFVVYQSTQVQ